MKTYGVGIIGCGAIFGMHAFPLHLLSNAQVGAVCDIKPEARQTAAALLDCDAYADYHEMLGRDDIDVVHILTPHYLHAPMAIDAMNAGKHVLTEKPMAYNLEECDAMIAAAEKNHVKLMVAYMKRYDPAYEWALGKFKDIQNLRLIRVHDFGGTYTINNKIYDLHVGDDLPAEVVRQGRDHERESMVKAIGQENADLYDTFSLLMYNCSHDAIVLHEAFGVGQIQHVELYDTFAVAILAYGPHTRCVWETGLIPDRTEWDENITAYGGNRRIEVKFPFPYLKNADTEIYMEEMEGDTCVNKRVLVSYDEAFKREWRHFYDCIVNDKEPITSGQKGRRDIAFLIDRLKAGAKNR